MDEMPEFPPAIHAIPVALILPKHFRFVRLRVAPGIAIHRFEGLLAKKISAASKNLPIPQPAPKPTHLILVDEEVYQENLAKQLRSENQTPGRRLILVVDGLLRQALITLTLLAGVSFTIYGDFSFSKPSARSKSSVWTGYSHRPTVGVSMLMQLVLGERRRRKTTPSRVRALAASLDRYYRADYWWTDPVSTALGYMWGSITTTDSALAFAGCAMALEALVGTPEQEITHSLAERCALLTARHGIDKLERYREIKRLYNLRSKIVHGKSSPKRGVISQRSLIVSAKYSNIPIDDLPLMLNIALDTIVAALASPGYLKVVHTKQSDEATTQALNAYFLDAILASSKSA